MTDNASHELHLQTEAAKALRANLKDIIGDDEDLAADTVEGETSIHEAMHAAVAFVTDLETQSDAIGEHIKKLKQRQERIDHRVELTRTAIAVAMQVAGKDTLSTPLGTVSLKKNPPAVDVVDESAIPSRFWTTGDPKLNKKAILEALKGKEDVPGAEFKAPSQTISIRV